MKKICLVCVVVIISACGRSGNQHYALGPDSQRHANVPRGTVTHYTWTSKVYPGTVRDYWVYVPKQYKPEKPACVMVFQDGGGFVKGNGSSRVPIVFDNLINRHQMPVTIGIFINPGVMPARAGNQRARYNRSYEYDSLGDRYARFLLDEILPEVGKHYNLSKNPDDRAIAGASSGGISAFTVAWTHPEAFHRVLSFIGSFTDLRGGDIYPALIRKTEPKPLRVFLQDGTKDLNLYAGNWYLNAQSMASALEFAGYDTKLVIGSEDHNMKQGGAILPDALRWLWRDYPKPIAKPQGGARDVVTTILDPGHDWEPVAQDYKSAGALAVNGEGDVYFSDSASGRILEIGTSGATPFVRKAPGVSALMFGPDNRLYACLTKPGEIAAYTVYANQSTVASGISCHDIAVTASGAIYFTDPAGKRVGYINAGGQGRTVYQGIPSPSAVRLSPDQSLLFAADSDGKWVWSFQVQPDGSLADGEPFYRLETSDESSATGASGMTVDTQGYLYVATDLGIEVCDQPGRVEAIISNPAAGPVSSLVFGGPGLQTLYVTAGGKIFRRHLRRTGVLPWMAVEPPVPHL
ncbi:MAG: SMP-30/gluconolactonase/LRE family protein [Terriglobia bacterium]